MSNRVVLACVLLLCARALAAQTDANAVARIAAVGVGAGSLFGVDNAARFTASLVADVHLDIAFTDWIALRVGVLGSAPFQAGSFVRLPETALSVLVGALFRNPLTERFALYGAFTTHFAFAPVTDQTLLFLLGVFGGLEGGVTEQFWLYLEVGGHTELDAGRSYPYGTVAFAKFGARFRL